VTREGVWRLHPRGAVVRVRAKIAADTPVGALGRLIDAVGLSPLADPRFSDLRPDEDDDWAGRATWCGGEVDLRVADDAFDLAGAVWDDAPAWDHRVRAFAVDRLRPLKNAAWLEEDEPPIDALGFAARLELARVDVSREHLRFWFRDGGLFWGHRVEVVATPADGPTHAAITG
jgi:hypothetical protein